MCQWHVCGAPQQVEDDQQDAVDVGQYVRVGDRRVVQCLQQHKCISSEQAFSLLYGL